MRYVDVIVCDPALKISWKHLNQLVCVHILADKKLLYIGCITDVLVFGHRFWHLELYFEHFSNTSKKILEKLR